ncbi:DUF4439 domain-containing protein [Arthrobacter sp. HLT1-20]
MTNPLSPAVSSPDAPAVPASGASAAAAKPKRKGPRRATAPAGAPATSPSGAPALLVVGADGVMVPPPAAEPMAEVVDAPAPAPHSVDEPASEPETLDAPAPEAEITAPDDDATLVPAADANERETVGGETAPADPDLIEDLVADVAAPLSRRERRLAEQGPVSGVAIASPAAATAAQALTGAPATEANGGATETSTKHQNVPARGRFASFTRGLFFLLVISLVVVGMGTVLAGHDEAAVGPSQTEANRQRAWEQTTQLLAQASHLTGSAGTPKAQELLNQAAKDLAVQAAALGNGLPASIPATPAPTQAPPTLAQFALALHTHGEELLGNAMVADYAMGRVFAAVGTSQLLQGQNLITVAGTTAQPSKFLPARIDFPAAVGPTCKSTLEPRPGATIDAALRAAALGEQKAVYAYQVATTRFAEPQFGSSSTLLARHERKLQILNEELALRCLPLATPVAGFAVDASFTVAPARALARLEGELGAIYGDLAALSPAGNPAEATPSAGTTTTQAAATAAAQVPSGTSNLREVSVAWLLDSAQAQQFWGGAVGALPGLAAAAPAPATGAP